MALTIPESAFGPDFAWLANWPSLEGALQIYSPGQAKILLADAGYPDGFDGLCIQPLEEMHVLIARRMVYPLSEVGIKVDVLNIACNSGRLFIASVPSRAPTPTPLPTPTPIPPTPTPPAESGTLDQSFTSPYNAEFGIKTVVSTWPRPSPPASQAPSRG